MAKCLFLLDEQKRESTPSDRNESNPQIKYEFQLDARWDIKDMNPCDGCSLAGRGQIPASEDQHPKGQRGSRYGQSETGRWILGSGD